ncbi:hypothetical protein [Dysgonomonas reticulitermitis]
MKKILYILFTISLFTACSSSDEENQEPIQDYTSFAVKNTFKRVCKNVVAGYESSDNTLKEIANLGNLAAGETSKEIKVNFTNIKEILLFEGALSSGKYSDVLILTDYKKFPLKENTKNIYTMPEDLIMELSNVNHTDPTQYPQKQ